MFARPESGTAQQELPLLVPHSWISTPSTKVRRPTQHAPFAWAYTYTAFSLPFAKAALVQLGARSGTPIIDPFVGSGTTMVAAAMRGCHALGVDISPFSALLTRTRIASGVDHRRVQAYLNVKYGKAARPAESSNVLQADDLAYAEAVIAHISDRCRLPPSQLWNELLADDAGLYDSEAVTLLSLAIAAKDCGQVQKGSNPVWLRRIPESDRHSRAVALASSSLAWSKIISKDLLASPPVKRKGNRIINTNFIHLNNTSQFDICLTSPPYLNRLDYVIAHLPELSMLQLVTPIVLDELRASMIGTTKIVSKHSDTIPLEWGRLCAHTLTKILGHSSYASKRYYYHTYHSYFRRIYESVVNLARMMSPKSQGIIVVQDSFYKDLNIPTPHIFAQMLESCACSARIVRTIPVRTHMGRMSPQQISYAPRKTLSESLVYFSRH